MKIHCFSIAMCKSLKETLLINIPRHLFIQIAQEKPHVLLLYLRQVVNVKKKKKEVYKLKKIELSPPVELIKKNACHQINSLESNI